VHFKPLTAERLSMTSLFKTVLYTSESGHAQFKREVIELPLGKPQAMLSELVTCSSHQLRWSPVGFQSEFHCTGHPQWVFILQGQMEIGLHGGVSQVFGPGEHFYSNDTLPLGVQFDPNVHGHWSRQVGPDALVTLFVKD
jgi:hypothetical protein